MRVGFIGTGAMGNPMARRLLEAGHHLTVYDIRREAAANLLALGADEADSPRKVAEASEVVFTSLPGPDEVEQVVFDPDSGVLVGLRPDSVYIDTTTNSVALFRRVAEACKARGIYALDAPISGGSIGGAEKGTLTIQIGGDETAFAKCRPLFEILGQHIFYLGEAGAGMIAKLINNHIVYSNFMAAAEALLMGAKAGINLSSLAEILTVSGANSVMLSFFPSSVFNRQFGSYQLDMAVKDLNLIHDMNRGLQCPSSIVEVVRSLATDAQTKGWGREGWFITVRILEEMAGARLQILPQA